MFIVRHCKSTILQLKKKKTSPQIMFKVRMFVAGKDSPKQLNIHTNYLTKGSKILCLLDRLFLLIMPGNWSPVIKQQLNYKSFVRVTLWGRVKWMFWCCQSRVWQKQTHYSQLIEDPGIIFLANELFPLSRMLA